MSLLAFLFLQTALVNVSVDASKPVGPNAPVWAYFGYDEPNYSTAPNGRKLLGELAGLSAGPVAIRVHNLLTSGDGSASLKWGSTNVYAEDAQGHPVYDWHIADGILDAIVNAGAEPLVEIGFMPEALSTHPQPYRHKFPMEKNVFTGWSYPPRDYSKWGELVYQWSRHIGERYGRARAAHWSWEVWNEPDIPYWHGTPEEYDRLYDFTVDAVRRALPGAVVGGPGSTGPANEKAAAFLKQFLQHCAHGKNAVTGGLGAPLDFISFHAKGNPKVVDGQLKMGLAKHLRDMADGFAIVRSFSQFQALPIILTESDPEGCAACSAPQNAYRDGTMYAVYMAESIKATRQLAEEAHVNLKGFLTWAFEFEQQPYFAGLRTLATNGIDQPVLNVLRMEALMRGEEIHSESDRAVPVTRILQEGVTAPKVNSYAARTGRTISVLVWNYQDAVQSTSTQHVNLEVAGLPGEALRPLLTHYRVDARHSNSYTAWQQMGSPQAPTPEQTTELQQAGQLQLLESPHYMTSNDGKITLQFSLPEQGVSLIQISW